MPIVGKMRSAVTNAVKNSIEPTRPLPSRSGRKERFTAEQIIAALKACGGIHLAAAQQLRCSPSTIANYASRYPEIAESCSEIVEVQLDFAESNLMRMIKGEANSAQQLTAIMFYLRTKAKGRGYATQGHKSRPQPPTKPAVVTVHELLAQLRKEKLSRQSA
jgi:hypothetical protein